MKKIAILTINDYNNYGNRLQNYATQETLKSLGFSVETVINNTNYSSKSNSMKNSRLDRVLGIPKKLNGMTVKEIFLKTNSRLWKTINKNKNQEYKLKRLASFKDFSKSYLEETSYSISEGNIPNDFSERFDYFITGSDQVWNPIFRYGSSVDFLTFAPKDKRIAYSPSFGINEIPSEYVENYKVWLSEMSKLSVRENAGATIIKELTGRNAIVLVDPTLMLTKEKWLSISKPAQNKTEKKFLLTYFLGGVPKEYQNRIQQIAQDNDLEIINLADIKDRVAFITGPSEFIDYINSASVFCTDSFHGVVFSVLLETPFIVFDRMGNLPSMNSRIETLLSTFRLESRHARNIKNNEHVFEANYLHVAPILEIERKKALDYLKESLAIEEVN